MNIDKALTKEEFEFVLKDIKNKDELNSFLEIIAQRKKKAENPCSCGMEINDFIKHGILGCDKCIDHFGEVLLSFLNKSKGKDGLVIDLQMKLKKAIIEEKYEEAAFFRDELKKMKIKT